jgi:hypothetical protein
MPSNSNLIKNIKPNIYIIKKKENKNSNYLSFLSFFWFNFEGILCKFWFYVRVFESFHELDWWSGGNGMKMVVLRFWSRCQFVVACWWWQVVDGGKKVITPNFLKLFPNITTVILPMLTKKVFL